MNTVSDLSESSIYIKPICMIFFNFNMTLMWDEFGVGFML